MADVMQFELVSPERSLASLQATEVRIPGAEGDLTAMPDHAPVITTLRPGVVRVVADGTTTEYFVTGGFAEITQSATSILAEHAMPVSDVTADMISKLVDTAEAAVESAADDRKDAVTKYAADILSVKTALGV
ncbi:MAG: F0F1 ATP synthase subunit epsilon [Pseudomonadota bacterium]